jgi:hypothetical protein
VGRLLAEHVELAQKVLLVEAAVLAFLTLAVLGLEHDERLHDLWLLGLGRRTEDGVVSRDVSPAQHPQSQFLSELRERLLLRLVLGAGEEEVSDGVVTLGGELGGEAVTRLADKEAVGDTSHDTCSITVTSIGTGCDHQLHLITAVDQDLLAPRWVMLHRILRASLTILCEPSPLIWQMKPTPHMAATAGWD